MKKITAIFLCVFMLAVTLSGFRAEAAPTASGSMKAFVTAMDRFLNSLMRFVPWDKLEEDDVIPLDPVAQFEVGFRPLFNLGVSKDSMEREKGSFGWKSVKYEERGNRFRIVCENVGRGRKNNHPAPAGAPLHGGVCPRRDGIFWTAVLSLGR